MVEKTYCGRKHTMERVHCVLVGKENTLWRAHYGEYIVLAVGRERTMSTICDCCW